MNKMTSAPCYYTSSSCIPASGRRTREDTSPRVHPNSSPYSHSALSQPSTAKQVRSIFKKRATSPCSLNDRLASQTRYHPTPSLLHARPHQAQRPTSSARHKCGQTSTSHYGRRSQKNGTGGNAPTRSPSPKPKGPQRHNR